MNKRNQNNQPKNVENFASAEMLFREAIVPEPTEKLSTGKNPVVKYGVDNLYPQHCFKWFYQSPIHGGIISQKVDFISGDGIQVVGPMASKSEEIIKNGGGMSLDEIIPSVALDFEVLEYFFYLFKKDSNGIWRVKELSAELIRPNESLTKFQYSENWKASQQNEKTGFKEYKSFLYVTEEDNECVMYVKSPAKQIVLDDGTMTTSIFPIQRYSGAIPSILADIEMNYFHYSEAVNGWTSNTILNLNNGVPSPTEKKKQLKEIRSQVTDRSKKGGVTVFWNDGKERAATVDNLGGNGNDTRYLLTQEHGFQTIMIAHSVQNPALFGLQVAGKLGNTSGEQVKQDFFKFMATYVSKRRKVILEALVHGLKKLNKWEGLEMEFVEFIPDWIESKEETTETPEPTTEDVLNAFSKVGTDIKDLTFIHSDGFDYKKTDEEFISEYVSQQFNEDINDNQNKILQMVRNGESYKAVVDALGIGAKNTSLEIIDLKKKGLLELDESGWKVSSTGLSAISTAETIKVFYTYEKRPDVDGASKLPDGRTRSFCAALIDANKAYTREEIDTISASIGRDVWLFRGGWYHNPDTGKNQPSCRHYWKQNIILE